MKQAFHTEIVLKLIDIKIELVLLERWSLFLILCAILQNKPGRHKVPFLVMRHKTNDIFLFIIMCNFPKMLCMVCTVIVAGKVFETHTQHWSK